MRSDNGAELFPVVDEAGNVMGAATRAQCHGGGMLLHPVVHLHLFNSRGELYPVSYTHLTLPTILRV